MVNCPRFVYGSVPTTLNLTWPARVWRPQSVRAAGGYRVLASGLAVGYTVRRDETVGLTLRATAAEAESLATMVRWAQDNPATTFTWRPDKDVSTTYTVYLHAPQAVGETFEPQTLDGVPGMWTVELVLRRSSGNFFALRYES
jgi:hypothetical protein